MDLAVNVLAFGSPAMARATSTKPLVYAALRADFYVLYCSVLDLVRELQADQSPAEARSTLARYLKPDLLCLDDFGMKISTPNRRRRQHSTGMSLYAATHRDFNRSAPPNGAPVARRGPRTAARCASARGDSTPNRGAHLAGLAEAIAGVLDPNQTRLKATHQ